MERRTRLLILLAAVGLALSLAGCAGSNRLVGYDRPAAAVLTGPAIGVRDFIDARPENEHTGAGVGLLNSSTNDNMYSESIVDGIARTLAGELRAAGIPASTDPGSAAPIIVSGVVQNFRAVRVPPLESYVPYLNTVTWMWTNDSIAVTLRVKLAVTDRERGVVILDKIYDVSHDTEVWVGFLNLDSRVNSFTHNDLAEILRAGLARIMQNAVADIRAVLAYRAANQLPR